MHEGGRVEVIRGFFGRMAEACRDSLVHYICDREPGRRFEASVLLALAAVDQAARTESLEPADLRFVRDAAADAAGVCRTLTPEETAFALAGCFEEAALGCSELLGDAAPDAASWMRFVFDDLDVAVVHRGVWQLRRGVVEASDRWFDLALEQLAPELTDHRIAEVTVHVLDWYAHVEALD